MALSDICGAVESMGLLEYARRMRKQPTMAEAALWRRLRHGQLGLRFRRQYPIAGYILDFYCRTARLAIEVDGGGHADDAQQAYDERRDKALSGAGIKVLRVWNHEILRDIDAVLEQILKAARGRRPRSGRGLRGSGRRRAMAR